MSPAGSAQDLAQPRDGRSAHPPPAPSLPRGWHQPWERAGDAVERDTGTGKTLTRQHRGLFLESCSLYVTLQTPALPRTLPCAQGAGHGHGPLPIPLPPSPTSPSPGPGRPRQPPAQSFIEVFAQKTPWSRHQPGDPASGPGVGVRGSLSCSRSSPAGATAGPAHGARTG